MVGSQRPTSPATSRLRIASAPGEPPGQLYDLEADPRETTNLAATQPAIVARLKAELARIQTSSRTRP